MSSYSTLDANRLPDSSGTLPSPVTPKVVLRARLRTDPMSTKPEATAVTLVPRNDNRYQGLPQAEIDEESRKSISKLVQAIPNHLEMEKLVDELKKKDAMASTRSSARARTKFFIRKESWNNLNSAK